MVQALVHQLAQGIDPDAAGLAGMGMGRLAGKDSRE